MAVVAVEPFRVPPVGDDGAGDPGPFGLEQDGFGKAAFAGRLDRELVGRLDLPVRERRVPVDPVSVPRLRKPPQRPEFLGALAQVPAVAALAVLRLLVAEQLLPVVTGPAEHPGAVRLLRDLRGVRLEVELELEMTDPAGVLLPVDPVGERRGFHAVRRRGAADQEVAVFLGRRRVGENEIPRRSRRGEQQQQDEQGRAPESLDGFCVASLAIDHREGHREMALPAVPARRRCRSSSIWSSPS